MIKEIVASTVLSIYTIMELASYTPQIVKIIKTKHADDISLTSWAMWVISDVCYLIYVILETPEPGIIFTSVLSLFFVLSIYGLTKYYQTNKK